MVLSVVVSVLSVCWWLVCVIGLCFVWLVLCCLLLVVGGSFYIVVFF